MGKPEEETRRMEGHNGTAKLIALVLASFVTGGGAGNVIGGINWANETKKNGENLAALKAEVDAKHEGVLSRLDKIDRNVGRIFDKLTKEGEQ